MILTPTGKLARYFFGIDYVPTDLRLSLEEASNPAQSAPLSPPSCFTAFTMTRARAAMGW